MVIKKTIAMFEARIDLINEARDKAILAQAKEVREEWILPVCEKTGWEFLSGNGDYFFVRGDARIGTEEDAKDLGVTLVGNLFKLLDLEIDRHTNLGHWIENVVKADFRCAE